MTTYERIRDAAARLRDGAPGSLQKAVALLFALAEYAKERVDTNWNKVRKAAG